MEEIIENVDMSGLARGAVSGFAEVVLWLAVIVLVATIIGLGWYFLSFKHKVRIREILKDGDFRVIDDKARRFKDKKGNVWWKLLKTRIKVVEPPSEAKEVTVKGKIVCEGYLLDGKFMWRKNQFDINKFKDNQAEYIEGGFDALSSGERAMYLDELEESFAYKKKKLIDLLWQATPIIGIIIMLTLFFIFFDNVITPGYEIAEQNARMVQHNKEIVESFERAMQIIDDLVRDRQTLLLEKAGEPPN